MQTPHGAMPILKTVSLPEYKISFLVYRKMSVGLTTWIGPHNLQYCRLFDNMQDIYSSFSPILRQHYPLGYIPRHPFVTHSLSQRT